MSSCYILISLHKLKKNYKGLSMNNTFNNTFTRKSKNVYFGPHGLSEFWN